MTTKKPEEDLTIVEVRDTIGGNRKWIASSGRIVKQEVSPLKKGRVSMDETGGFTLHLAEVIEPELAPSIRYVNEIANERAVKMARATEEAEKQRRIDDAIERAHRPKP